MPPRRQPKSYYNIKILIILIIITPFIYYLLLWLVDVRQQYLQAFLHQINPTVASNAIQTLHKSGASQDIITPIVRNSEKNSHDLNSNVKYVSNKATLAPAQNAVAAPSLRLSSRVNAETSSPQNARSLGDWEVEDFVLLATVDGTLYARDRKTGKERWHISYEKPMVQIEYHPKSFSATRDYDPTSIDDYLWILEPSRDGLIYIYKPYGMKPGLVNTGLTMKNLVDMTPYADEDPSVVYTGKKKTNVLTIDANTGKVLSWFGSVNSLTTKEICDADEESSKENTKKCPRSANLILGRTEYTVGVFGRNDGHHIATLKFSEWSPNNYDQDLQRQYTQYAATLDHKYIYTGYNGGIISLDCKQKIDKKKPDVLFQQKLPSPVVRVFDVARTWGSDKKNLNLVILHQPQPPIQDSLESNFFRASNIFLNHTEDGSWYAISSNQNLPLIDSIQLALCSQENQSQCYFPWNVTNKAMLSQALTGLHSVENMKNSMKDNILTISGTASEHTDSGPRHDHNQIIPHEDTSSYKQFLNTSRIALQSLLELLKNPILLFMMLGMLMFSSNYTHHIILNYFKSNFTVKTNSKIEMKPRADINPDIEKKKTSEFSVGNVNTDYSPKNPAFHGTNRNELIQGFEKAITDVPKDENSITEPEIQKKKEKKSHRGRRGGVKHKKRSRNNIQDKSIITDQKSTNVSAALCEISTGSHKSSQHRKFDSDFHSTLNIDQNISGSSVRVGALEVDTDKLIGTGSNGTMVFKGKFDGREVAVKRMLIQFFDIALQETRLLRESDDHPNVIRYFAQQQSAGFLYIALELCPASLADLIEKPLNHAELAQAGEKDLPNVLYQISNGLHHLHKLRIVHRDLKPQNILVSIGKDEKPRLVVSDFGLCKKLEGENSSFRATTAHAAGTSGWRAPELLLDDDSKSSRPTIFDASTEGNSNSAILNSNLFPDRRATRAIDIFSLGLIFFYVLTKGGHPFDCGDRFMREVNIRQGKYDLRPLEILGDLSFEARDLIESMLSAEPKHRPLTHQVMAHPFFWPAKKRLNFLCDVSDHFEKEKRDPATPALQKLESYAEEICGSDFLKFLSKDFIESMGKQRKYTGTRLLDLLRALRNKKNHFEDMSEKLKKDVGPLPDGYLRFWSLRFPQLLIVCWKIVDNLDWNEIDRFKEYYEPGGQ